MAGEEETNLKKFSNWLQLVFSLEETKVSLGQYVLDIWKGRIRQWRTTEDLENVVLIFLQCVAEENIKYIKKKGWKCQCTHQYCATILEDLVIIQQNPGPSVVWNSSLCEKIVNGSVELQSQQNRQSDGTEDISRPETTNFQRILHLLSVPFQCLKTEERDVNFEDIFVDCKNEYVWCIANMFMQRGKAKSNVQNTGPDDTDAAMFFRMMKNCKLFELEDENHLYDDILLCRDRLFHSPNNRIRREEAESYFNTMTSLLKKFDNRQKCKHAIERIEQMRNETIVCISIPDESLREKSTKGLELKKSALLVDTKFDEVKGFYDDDMYELLEETCTELENTDPDKPLNEAKSRAELKQEIEKYKKEIGALKQQIDLSEVQRRTDQPSFQEERKTVPKSSNVSKKHFKAITDLLQTSLDNPHVVDIIKTQVNPLLDQVVEDLSINDSDFGKRAKELAESEISVERTTRVRSSIFPERRQHLSVDNIKPVPDVRLSRRSVVIKQRKENEKKWDIIASCQLPSGESLLADQANERLMKLDTIYIVIAVLDFQGQGHLWDVCYIDNNEAVVSVSTILKFIDVVSMTVTRSTETEHECQGLACHGNLLYVAADDSVYEYSTDGIKHRVLYTNHSSSFPEVYFLPADIAVSDDGSMIYILKFGKLTAINNSGNHMYTFENPGSGPLKGLCVDGEGHVLVCDRSSGNILQISSDGGHIRTTAAEADVFTLHFDRQRSKLICGGNSNTLTVINFFKTDL